MKNYPHYLERLQAATRNYWDKSALNTYKGEGFTYGQMATLIEKYHIFFRNAGFVKGDKMALSGKNGARWGMTYLAINTYEAVVVPILNDFLPESVCDLTNHSDAHKQLEDKENHQRLQDAITSLTDKQRALIRMRNVENLSYAEIAKMLGTSESSVRAMICKARAALINKMQKSIC